MEIRIDDKYLITSDKYQWIVSQIYKVIDGSSENFGEERTRIIAYYKSIKYLVEFLLHKEISESTCNSFTEIKSLIEKFGLSCEQAFNQQKGE